LRLAAAPEAAHATEQRLLVPDQAERLRRVFHDRVERSARARVAHLALGRRRVDPQRRDGRAISFAQRVMHLGSRAAR
jgi:hypothetical protein